MLKLIVTLRKEVETLEQAEALYNLVVTKMADNPDVDVRGSVSNHYPVPEEP